MVWNDYKRVLAEQGYTQSSAARAIGVSKPMVSHMLTRKNRAHPTEDSLYKLLGGEWDRRDGGEQRTTDRRRDMA